MKFFTFGCSGVAVVAAATTSVISNVVLADLTPPQQHTNANSNANANTGALHHRYLLPASLSDQNIAECVLYLKDVQWEDGHHDESWSCQFTTTKQWQVIEDTSTGTGTSSTTVDNSFRISKNVDEQEEDHQYSSSDMITMMNIEGIPKDVIDLYEPISGGSILKIKVTNKVDDSSSQSSSSSSYLQQSLDGNGNPLGEMKLIVTEDTKYVVDDLQENDYRHYKSRRRRSRRRNLVQNQDNDGNGNGNGNGNGKSRNLADAIGTLETLVVRVITPNGSQINANSNQLINDIFTDDFCLKTGYAQCSKDQLIINPANEGNGGVIDINIQSNPSLINDVDSSRGNEGTLRDQALAELWNDGLIDNIDLVMMCLPDGTGNWIAYAYINYWLSVYNDSWCQKVSVQMHEVGHNLNLAHSNEGELEYSDITGMMVCTIIVMYACTYIYSAAATTKVPSCIVTSHQILIFCLFVCLLGIFFYFFCIFQGVCLQYYWWASKM
jgi:hypothetical protein